MGQRFVVNIKVDLCEVSCGDNYYIDLPKDLYVCGVCL
jgi:hypothetical protein